MTIQARVAELEQQHHALDKKIAEALKHKSTDAYLSSVEGGRSDNIASIRRFASASGG